MGTVTETFGTLTQIGGTQSTKTWVRRLDRVTPNPYTHAVRKVLSSGGFMRPGDCYFSESSEYAGFRAGVQNQLYAKWVDALGQQAQLGANLGERRQAATMISARAMQLYRSYKLLRQGNLMGAAQMLNIDPKYVPSNKRTSKGWRKGSRDIGSTWLEWHFGWSPLVADIYTCVDVLTREPPPLRVSVSTRKTLPVVRGNTATYAAFRLEKGTIEYSMSAHGSVVIDNPDLYLVSELGLANPLSVAWELIPMSFLVDWFSNVSQVLASITGVMGVSYINPCWTAVTKTEKSITTREESGGPVKSGNGTSFVCVRTVGLLPGPVLKFQIPERLSVSRGVTAVSLLLQLLKGK